MNIIAVDDEPLALEGLQQAIEEAIPDCSLSCFDTSVQALGYAEKNEIYVAFLDIALGEMNGLTLAKQLKEINGKINIVFATGYSNYAVDAFSVKASDYLLKPVTAEAVERAMERLRDPVSVCTDEKIRVQTFGYFEVFVYGKHLDFSRSKSKELLAYLVSRRGAFCANNDIISVIWENKEDSHTLNSHFRHLVADLIKTLNHAGIKSLLVKKRGYLAVVPESFQCDLYDFYRGNTDAVNSYTGEFMAQYGWAEFTNGYLENTLYSV